MDWFQGVRIGAVKVRPIERLRNSAAPVREIDSAKERLTSFEIAIRLRKKIPDPMIERYIDEDPRWNLSRIPDSIVGRHMDDGERAELVRKKFFYKMNVLRRCLDLFVARMREGVPDPAESEFAIRLMKKSESTMAMVFLLNILEEFSKKDFDSIQEAIYLAACVSSIIREVSSHHCLGRDLVSRIPEPVKFRIGRMPLPEKTRKEINEVFWGK